MRTGRWAALAGATAAVAASVGACSSGATPPLVVDLSGRDDPGTTRDTPPSTRDEIAGACVQCDVYYACSIGGGFLFTSTAPCPSGVTSCLPCTPSLVDFFCSGALFDAGGGCTGGGAAGFSCGGITCVPGDPPQNTVGIPGTPQGGSSGG